MACDLQETTVPDGGAIVDRLWAKDPTLWSVDEDKRDSIEKRLGWLAVPTWLGHHIDELRERVSKIQTNNWQRIVLLGMGGSSLAPKVLAQIAATGSTGPRFEVLDSTYPDTVRRVTTCGDLSDTLFLVSSKSGTTLEVMALWSYFDRLLRVDSTAAKASNRNFVAITDAGTPLEVLARERGFLDCFVNPTDVGGRFSVLTYFGMVPAALLGLDLRQMLDSVERQMLNCQAKDAETNDALLLGWRIGAHAAQGRNKLTLLLSPENEPLGIWIEQLLAESTGKDGRGIIPIVDEPLQPLESYGTDRVFVAILTKEDDALMIRCDELESAGFPVLRLMTRHTKEIGGEFFRWEFATAVAGVALEINPFDEPDVQHSKDATVLFLGGENVPGQTVLTPCVQEGELSLVGEPTQFKDFTGVAEGLSHLLNMTGPGDYIAILAWLDENETLCSLLEKSRVLIGGALGVPVTLGFGPRYLHSTGQLHKGGSSSGVFLQLTSRGQEDVAIPGHDYSFADLHSAQADADLTVLSKLGRRVARINLGRDPVQGLIELASALEVALSS
jgi:glucose-6-phosphate isomerase